jgi:mono/diheme cytochrome c family protein
MGWCARQGGEGPGPFECTFWRFLVTIPRFVLPFASLVLAGFATGASAADAALVAKGKGVFDGAKPACKVCHNANRNPLDNYGARGTVAEVKAWLRTPKEMLAKNGKKGPKPTFGPDKISDPDLEALAAYLVSLKK